MKIEIEQTQLAAAQSLTDAGSGTGDESNFTAHYLFRTVDGKVELIANNQRVVAYTPLVAAVVDGDGAFTTSKWRLKGLLPVSRGKITLEDKDLIVQYSTSKYSMSRGSGKLASLDPAMIPVWDKVWAEAETKATISASRLHRVFTYMRKFVSEEEAKSPQLVAIATDDNGLFQATDIMAITIAEIAGLNDGQVNVEMRLHRQDIGSVLNWLGLVGDEDIEIRQHAEKKILFFVRKSDGAKLGISFWGYQFPKIAIDRTMAIPSYFIVNVAEMTEAFKYLAAFGVKDDKNVTFTPDPKNPKKIKLSMADAARVGSDTEVEIECDGDMSPFLQGGKTSFTIRYDYVEKVVIGEEMLRFDIGWTPKNGFCRFTHKIPIDDAKSAHDDFMTILVWNKR